jgi:hypothetical protein
MSPGHNYLYRAIQIQLFQMYIKQKLNILYDVHTSSLTAGAHIPFAQRYRRGKSVWLA